MSGADDILSGVQSITTTITSGVNTVVRTSADLGLGGVGNPGTYWSERLQPASFRGIPFGVLDGESRFGRKNVVHEYPYRDQPWIEDMGKSARVIGITGFLVENGGYLTGSVKGPGSVIGQRDRLIAAAESATDLSLLVHPTYGQLKVNLVGPLVVTEAWDRGRVFEIRFSFIESGARLFPSNSASTKDAVDAECKKVDYAMAQDFQAKADGALSTGGAAAVQQAATTAGAWGREIQRMSNDATNLMNTVSSLQGNYGRFSGGRTMGGLLGAAAAVAASSAATVQSLVAAGSAARSAVASAVSTLTSTASSLGKS